MKKFWRDRDPGPIEAIHPATGKTILVHPQKDALIGLDLNKEHRRMSGLYGWYSALRDRAAEAYREARHEEHNADEELYEEFRASLPKTTTETAVKNKVKNHPRMRAAFRARMDAKAMLQRLESAVKTMDVKSHSLSGLSKTYTTEYHTKDHF